MSTNQNLCLATVSGTLGKFTFNVVTGMAAGRLYRLTTRLKALMWPNMQRPIQTHPYKRVKPTIFLIWAIPRYQEVTKRRLAIGVLNVTIWRNTGNCLIKIKAPHY